MHIRMDKKLDFPVNDKRTAFGRFDPGRHNDSLSLLFTLSALQYLQLPYSGNYI